MAWQMMDGRDTDSGWLMKYPNGSHRLIAVRWEDTVIEGNTMTVECYMSLDNQVYLANSYACEHDTPPNGWGYLTHIDAITYPESELLSSHEFCVGTPDHYFPKHTIEVEVPDEPGVYTVRLVFMRPASTGVGEEMMFPEQQHSSADGLYSEVHIPVTVNPSGAQCSGNAGCPDGFECVNGSCRPDPSYTPPDDDVGGCHNNGQCPPSYVCRDGDCVPPTSSPDPQSGANVGLALGLGGAAYLYLRNRGD